ncbi:MAG TPA: DUF5696 domain-containing protein, partial [Phycisphaerae bacterium]|nr:DUF5696 domain-containing protein [Phycisphaerae bacterium]
YSKFRDAGTNWMGDRDLTCTTDEELAESVCMVKRGYEEFEKLKRLQLEFMESHGPLADDVFKTTFSDGTSIITNYRAAPYEYGSRAVPSMGYVVVKD